MSQTYIETNPQLLNQTQQFPTQIQNGIQKTTVLPTTQQNSIMAWLKKYWWLIAVLILVIIAFLIWLRCSKSKKIGNTGVASGISSKLNIVKSRLGPLYD